MALARHLALLPLVGSCLLFGRAASGQPQPEAPPAPAVVPPENEAAAPPPAPPPEVAPAPDATPDPAASEDLVAPEPLAAEPTAEPEPDETAEAIGALEAFHWSGYLQAQYEIHGDSENEVDGSRLLNLDRFGIRRGRLKLKYEGIEHARFVLEIDGTPTGMGLKEGTVSLIEPWTGWDLELAFGLFKTPFGFETLQSSSDNVFPDPSLLSHELFPGERDVGLRLTAKHGLFQGLLAVVNGNPLGDRLFGGRDPNSYKDLVGRLGLHLSFLDVGVSGHVGTEFQPGTPATDAATTWLDANGDSVVDPSEVTTTEAAAAVPSANATRWRAGFDAELHHEIGGLGRFELDAEVAYGSRVATDVAPEQELLVGTVAVIQHWHDRAGLAFRATVLDPDLDARDDREVVLEPVLLLYPVPAVRVSFTYALNLEEGDAVSNDVFTARMQIKF